MELNSTKFSNQNVRCQVQLRQQDKGIALIEGHSGAGNVRIRAHSFLQGGMASSQWVFLGTQSRQIIFLLLKAKKSQDKKQDQQELQSRKIMWMDEKATQGFRYWGRSRAGSKALTSLEWHLWHHCHSLYFCLYFVLNGVFQTSLLIHRLMRLYFGLSKSFFWTSAQTILLELLCLFLTGFW